MSLVDELRHAAAEVERLKLDLETCQLARDLTAAQEKRTQVLKDLVRDAAFQAHAFEAVRRSFPEGEVDLSVTEYGHGDPVILVRVTLPAPKNQAEGDKIIAKSKDVRAKLRELELPWPSVSFDWNLLDPEPKTEESKKRSRR